MKENKDIQEAAEELEYLNGDYEAQRLVDLREKAIRDEASALAFATKKGLNQGIEQGLKRGHEKGLRALKKTAKRLLDMGMSVEDIAKATELSKEEILKLK